MVIWGMKLLVNHEVYLGRLMTAAGGQVSRQDGSSITFAFWIAFPERHTLKSQLVFTISNNKYCGEVNLRSVGRGGMVIIELGALSKSSRKWLRLCVGSSKTIRHQESSRVGPVTGRARHGFRGDVHRFPVHTRDGFRIHSIFWMHRGSLRYYGQCLFS